MSTMVMVMTAGVPSLAFETLLKMMLKVSFDSLVVSSFMTTVKLFDDSPGAKFRVPARPL